MYIIIFFTKYSYNFFLQNFIQINASKLNKKPLYRFFISWNLIHSSLELFLLRLVLTENFLQNAGVCRVHGRGFAGTIKAFVPDHLVEAYHTHIENFFGGGTGHILKIRKQGGIKVM